MQYMIYGALVQQKNNFNYDTQTAFQKAVRS